MTTHTYTRTVLPNGVRLLIIPMGGVSSVATSVMAGVGSRYEVPKINGISHFLEHMVFKGTQKYPTTDDVNVIERIGGIQNAYTDIDITSYHNKVLASDWHLGLEINTQLATQPLLAQEHVDRERDVILEEMKRYEDEPAAKVGETLHQMMYPGTTLGMRIIGEVGSLKSSDAGTLHDFHRAWYTPDQLTITLAGAISEKDIPEVTRQVEAWFGGLTGKADGSFVRVEDQQDGPRFEVVTKNDAQQAHFEMALRTFARRSEDRFAWNVFNLLMGVSFTSRLFREIREKRGLCYHIRSQNNAWADVGYWTIYAGVATGRVEEAVEATLAELARARDEGVTQEEVNVAIKRLKTLLAFKAENPEFIGEYYGRQETFKEQIMTLDEYLRRIETVTADEVNDLLKRYIKSETLNLALVWNKGKEESVAKLLAL